jgi:hypothetical protein
MTARERFEQRARQFLNAEPFDNAGRGSYDLAKHLAAEFEQVAAEEREACAKAICPLCARGVGYTRLAHKIEGRGHNIERCEAAAIRARGGEREEERKP